MVTPVYGLFLGKTKEAGHQLSQDERDALLAKRNENLAQVGGKDIIGCQAYASEWEMFGIVEYPSAEAQREHEMFCDSIGFKRYFELKIVTGVAMPDSGSGA